MSRFFVQPENVGENTVRIENREDLHHIMKVLRLSPGDKIDVSDSSEWEYRVELLYLDSERAEGRILDKQRFTTEPDVNITLFQGIPKQGKMETIVQKCVELGVMQIVPVFMARTVVVDKGNFNKKVQRWQKVSDESVKQCKRGIIPEVTAPVRLTEIINQFDKFDLVLFPYENEMGITIKAVLRQELSEAETQTACGSAGNFTEKPNRIAVIIGPEGGFSEEEAALIVNAGGKSVSLGRTTLRTETAGPAAIAMIMYELEL